MTKELTAAFVEEVKAGFTRRDPMQRRLTIASYELDDSRDYFRAVMKANAREMRAVLADIMAHGPDDDDPSVPMGQRAQAAYWFLSGSSAGYWTATLQETETARVLIAIGGFAMAEKTKADLAREAGLPTEDMVIVKPRSQPTKAPKARPAVTKADRDDNLSLHVAITQAGARMEAGLKDPAATAEAKLEAIDRWLRIVGRIAPDELDASLAGALKTYPTTPHPKL